MTRPFAPEGVTAGMDIDILLFDGFDELDAIGPYEVFQNASRAGASLKVTLTTLHPTELVRASHGLRVEPDKQFSVASSDLVLVPGGGWNDRGAAGAWAEAERGDLPAAVARSHEAGSIVASVCTGGMLLARAGLTEGRPATTHAGALSDLETSGAELVDARVVDDGTILTAGGVTAGLDLAFHLVEREFGIEVATSVSTTMEYERRGPVYRSQR